MTLGSTTYVSRHSQKLDPNTLGVKVCSIDGNGLAAAWNRQHPMWAIGIGDRILAVNSIRSPEVMLEQLSSDTCHLPRIFVFYLL